MNEDSSLNIVSDVPDVPQLRATRVVPAQKWCAYTYLIAKEPKEGIHGTLKVLCVGSTQEEVKSTLRAMWDAKELNPHLPFVRVAATGHWQFLNVAAKEELSDAYNMQTKSMATEFGKEFDERRREAERELRERAAELQRDQEEELKNGEDTFETYTFNRMRKVGVIDRIRVLEEELKKMKKLKVETIRTIHQLERAHPLFRRKFEKDAAPMVHKEQYQEDEIPQEELDQIAADQGLLEEIPAEKSEEAKGKEEEIPFEEN